jgi:uncharacterized membrane protein YqaE (UPF0057 family)
MNNSKGVVTLLYLLAIICPPLAVLLVGKPIQAIINLVLTLFFYVPGLIHAVLVVKDKKDDKRMKKQAELISKASK